MDAIAETNRLQTTEAAELASHADVDLNLGETRAAGINIGGHTVTQATANLPEDHRDLVRWVHDHARNMRWTWKELETETGIDKTVLFKVFNDRYRDGSGRRVGLDGICAKIAKLKRREMARGQAENQDFIETSVWNQIDWLCGRAMKHHRMGFIFGDSQIGKTTSLKERTRRNNGGRTTYAEMPPASGCQYMLKCIARPLKVPVHSSFDHMLDDIIGALDPSKQLIMDEFQRVFTTYQKTSVMRCLDTIRYIHDQTGCSIIVSATNVFRDQMRSGEFMKYLEQLQRRGKSYELQLPTTTPRADLDLFAKKYGLPPADGEAETVMTHIAKQDGLGVFIMRLVDAKELANNKGVKPTWDHFLRAFAITEKASGAQQK
jgi:DNA transposition AAA+ family ATPase